MSGTRLCRQPIIRSVRIPVACRGGTRVDRPFAAERRTGYHGFVGRGWICGGGGAQSQPRA
eukprot:2829755-Rhodomonas_salina.1